MTKVLLNKMLDAPVSLLLAVLVFVVIMPGASEVPWLAGAVGTIFLGRGMRYGMRGRELSRIMAIRQRIENPPEGLRELYQQIDRECEITDEECLTPDAPLTRRERRQKITLLAPHALSTHQIIRDKCARCGCSETAIKSFAWMCA